MIDSADADQFASPEQRSLKLSLLLIVTNERCQRLYMRS